MGASMPQSDPSNDFVHTLLRVRDNRMRERCW